MTKRRYRFLLPMALVLLAGARAGAGPSLWIRLDKPAALKCARAVLSEPIPGAVWLKGKPDAKALSSVQAGTTAIVPASPDYQELGRVLAELKKAGLASRGVVAIDLSSIYRLPDLEERLRFIRTRYPESPGVALDGRKADPEFVAKADALLGKYFTGPVLLCGSPEIKLADKQLSVDLPVTNIGESASRSVTAALEGKEQKLDPIPAGGKQILRLSIPTPAKDTVLRISLSCPGATIVRQPSPIAFRPEKR